MAKEFLLFDGRTDSYPRIKRTIRNTALPPLCTIPLIVKGKQYYPAVEIGQAVKEGEVVATCSNADTDEKLFLYSPIPGVVSSLKPVTIGETDVPTVQVHLSGEFSILGKQKSPVSWTMLSARELRKRAMRYGIGSVWEDLFDVKKQKKILVVQICDMEPYLSSERQILQLYPQQVLGGLRIAEKILESTKTVLICPSSNKSVLHELEEELQADMQRHIYYLDIFRDYMKFNSSVLFRVLQKNFGNVDMGDLAVIPASALYALYDTIRNDKPFFERIISVAGEGIAKPAHLKVRVGTLISDVLKECGGKHHACFTLLGGPFTGVVIKAGNVPVSIDTSAILLLSERQVHQSVQTSCIRCGACTRVCPSKLNPRMLVRMLERNRRDLAVQNGLNDCIECGLCTFVCPSRILLFEQLVTRKGNA